MALLDERPGSEGIEGIEGIRGRRKIDRPTGPTAGFTMRERRLDTFPSFLKRVTCVYTHHIVPPWGGFIKAPVGFIHDYGTGIAGSSYIV